MREQVPSIIFVMVVPDEPTERPPVVERTPLLSTANCWVSPAWRPLPNHFGIASYVLPPKSELPPATRPPKKAAAKATRAKTPPLSTFCLVVIEGSQLKLERSSKSRSRLRQLQTR